MPERIQRQRTKGWRMPDGAVYVGRPTIWGNPIPVPTPPTRLGRNIAAGLYRVHLADALERSPGMHAELRARLAGRDLACWCPLDQPCHADVLLELANGGRAVSAQDHGIRTSDHPEVRACTGHDFRARRYRTAWNAVHVSWVCVWCDGVMCGNWREVDPCIEPYHHQGDHRARSGATWPLGGRRG